MCLILILLFLGPRTAIFFWWLTDSARWERVYDSFLVPFIGFVLLPWTTLMWTVVAPGGVNGLDVLWVGLAVLVDLASSSGSGGYGYQRRSSSATPVYE